MERDTEARAGVLLPPRAFRPRVRLTRARAARSQVRLLILAALCGEHLLLLGRPGTAKSELGRRLRCAKAGERTRKQTALT